MEQDTNIATVWNEITISPSGIGITLYSESRKGGAVVEDETWFTFDEVENRSGEILSLNLSDETQDNLDNMVALFDDPTGQDSDQGPTHDLPSVGDVMLDTGDLPRWSEDNRVRILKVTDTPAKEYVVENDEYSRTVEQLNPGEPDDAPVVIGEYLGTGSKEYAFPVTRLSQME